jgi:hypothetical protein
LTRTGPTARNAALARTITFGLIAAMLALCPSLALARQSGQHNQAIKQVTDAIGASFDDLNLCLDAFDEQACFEELRQVSRPGAYIAGFGFAVGAILKFKAHKDNPTVELSTFDELDVLTMCLESGEDPQICSRTIDPSLFRLALLLSSYRELRPYCAQPGVLCDRPADWPSQWPWPFQETSPESRR